jgi:hypothetical protein
LNLFRRLLTKSSGPLPGQIDERLNTLSPTELAYLSSRFIVAQSLADLFQR